MGNEHSRSIESERVYQRMKDVYDQQIADEIELRNAQFENEIATKVAARKRSCIYEGIGVIATISAISAASFKYKAPLIASTLTVPILFLFGYRVETAYGDQLKRIQDRATELLHQDKKKFEVFKESVTLTEVDERIAVKENLKKEAL
uniref:DUF4231 domain-containing protein n=1 Tax=Syphacia muris TaxID=451379 RepID=A0A0N5ANM4_9BILA